MNGLRRGGIFAQVLALSLLGVQVPDRHAEAVSRAEEALLGALNYLPEGWDRSEAFRLLRADAGARAAAGPAFADAVADVVELMQRWSNEGWRPVRAGAEQGDDGWTCSWLFAGPGCYQIHLSRPGDDVLPEATHRTAPEAREAVLAISKRLVLEHQLAASFGMDPAEVHKHVERLITGPDYRGLGHVSPSAAAALREEAARDYDRRRAAIDTQFSPAAREKIEEWYRSAFKSRGDARRAYQNLVPNVVAGVDLGTGDESVRITRDGGRVVAVEREDSFARAQRLAFNTTADRARASMHKAAASVATLGEAFKGASTSIREFKRYSARPPQAPRPKSPELRESRRAEKRAAKAKRGRAKSRRGFA